MGKIVQKGKPGPLRPYFAMGDLDGVVLLYLSQEYREPLTFPGFFPSVFTTRAGKAVNRPLLGGEPMTAIRNLSYRGNPDFVDSDHKISHRKIEMTLPFVSVITRITSLRFGVLRR